MTKRPFIRATEVWVPSKDRTSLEFGDGLYGSLTNLEELSKTTTFQYDEGLPGKAWAGGRPIVLKDLVNSYFKRGAEASAAQLTCGVAVPVFAGRFLLAVMVMFCGEEADHVGAIEVWRTPPGSNEMGLEDGYFGRAESFEFRSRHIKFMSGFGLPGLVWEANLPVLMEDLGRSNRFLRGDSAVKVGINRGIGIPCGRDGDAPSVLTLLSALGTPIARRFEIWVPDEARGVLRFNSGLCETDGNLEARFAHAEIPEGEGTIGSAWRSGIPGLCPDVSREPEPVASSAAQAGLKTLVAFPVISAGALRAMVTLYL